MKKTYEIIFTRRALEDAKKLAPSHLKTQAEALLALIARDPFANPPPFEKLIGDMAGMYSRRINIQHRIVYEVLSGKRIVKVLRMWTHYE